MKINQEKIKIIQERKSELPILDELEFSNEEIDRNFANLIRYLEDQIIHNKSKDECFAKHFRFVRNNQNVIRTEHYYCDKQRKSNSIHDNIIISDYENYDDYQKILKTSEDLTFFRTEKRNKYNDYIKNNFTKSDSSKQAGNCYIFGEMLSGKSFAGFYLLKCCLYFKKDKKVAYINIKNFCNKVTDSYSNINNSKEQLTKYINTLLDVDYLFIDDIGTEKQSLSSLNKFDYVIKERSKSKTKTTILISSKNVTKLKKHYIDSLPNDINYVNETIERIKQIAKENEIEIDKVV